LQETIPKRRLRCSIEKFDQDPFFSLVDYRNNLFTSSDPKKVTEFYNGFESRDELIEWMRERPKGASYIHEVEGEKDIIVVIPTADFNGKYARECRENIFKGLHMIFVESGEVPDPYFSFARNANVGIKKALEYNPEWIVISNDDMHKGDDVSILTSQLNDPTFINRTMKDHVGILFAYPPTSYYSRKRNVSAIRVAGKLILLILYIFKRDPSFKIYMKFGVKYVISPKNFMYKLFLRKIFDYTDPTSFAVFNAKMCGEFSKEYGYVYDPTFITCREESDLAVRIKQSGWNSDSINFRIPPMRGMYLGVGKDRYIRDQAGVTYFSIKMEQELGKGDKG